MKNKKKFILIILISLISLISINFICVGNDYYWHVKAGNYMVSNHNILLKDIFSWYVKGKNWMSHEWLYECIIYTLKMLFGKYHIPIYCFINSLLLLSILFLNNKAIYKKNIIFTLLWLSLFLFINVGLFTPRPHMISSWLLALTLYLLYDLRRNKDSKKIYFLPLISLFWANVHGGSSNLSYILCIIFIISGLFKIDNKYIKINKLDKKQIKKYIIVMILILISININPHGYKMIIYPYENLFNKFMQEHISEWHPTSFTEGYHYIYFVTLIGIIITFIKGKKKIEFIDLIIFLLFSYMGLRSIRFWNYIYIGTSFFIFDYIKARAEDKNESVSIIIFCAIFSIIVLFNLPKKIEKINNEKLIPEEIISEIKKQSPKRLFNLYDDGGYLIYNDIYVFIDGRADLYSNYNYNDYIKISDKKSDYKELIKKYNFDYYIVNKKFYIYKYLNKNKKFELIKKSKDYSLYKKK